MPFPICGKCAASGVLCDECVKKEREGKLSELDVLLSTLLASHGVNGYDEAREIGDKLVIFASGEETSKIIGTKGNTAADISRKLGRRIIVIDKSWDKDLLIKSLARPMRLMAKNRIYKQGGGEVLKLIFDKPLDEGIAKLVKELVGGVEIEHQKIDYPRKEHTR